MATALSGMLVMNDREAVVDATAESKELDFNIARGQAIGVLGVDIEGLLGDIDGAAIELGLILTLDGPNFASNAISTKALFEAQEVLDSSIAQLHIKGDISTNGGHLETQQKTIWFPEPIFTARNLGVSYLAEGASGEGWFHVYYKYFDITAQEFVVLFTDQRA